MMNIKKEIISEFKELEIINKIYLFGSRVDNPDKQKADIDLCFVIDNDSNHEQIAEIAAEIIVKTSTIIHPVIFEQSEFEKKMNINVYKNSILKKGKIL